MPLPLPNLDDRRWADLIEESRALIPRYAPSWTDHNVHDPGITLMELFAWLAEMNIYRLNQVPARHLLKFLALIGFSPKPPQPARTILCMTPDTGTHLFVIPKGAVFETNSGTVEGIRFQTQNDLTVVDARLAAVQVDSGEGLRDRMRALRDGLPLYPFGKDPQAGSALYLGLDASLTLPAGETVSLGFHFTEEVSPWEERSRILTEAYVQAEAYSPPCPGTDCNGDPWEDGRSIDPALPSHHSVQLVWEFFDGSKWVALRPDTGEVADDTRSLTLDGVIRLTMPSADTVAATTIGEIDRAYYYLRCRFSKGQYDTPPQIAAISVNAVTARQIDPAWQRLTIAAGATVIGTPSEPGTRTRFDVDLDHTGTVAALSFTPDDPDRPEVRIFDYKAPTTNEPGWLAMEMVCLGVADGKPHQQVQLEPSLVVADSVRLYSLEDTLAGRIWRLWECRPDLDASRRADAHYTLVPSTGEVAFGDGERGRVSVRGAALMAAYDATQADEGNLPAATPLRLANTPGNEVMLAGLADALRENVREQLGRIVTNPQAATGGKAAESLMSAIGRAVETPVGSSTTADAV